MSWYCTTSALLEVWTGVTRGRSIQPAVWPLYCFLWSCSRIQQGYWTVRNIPDWGRTGKYLAILKAKYPFWPNVTIKDSSERLIRACLKWTPQWLNDYVSTWNQRWYSDMRSACKSHKINNYVIMWKKSHPQTSELSIQKHMKAIKLKLRLKLQEIARITANAFLKKINTAGGF